MTPQEIWWKTYFAALSGALSQSFTDHDGSVCGFSPNEAVTTAEMAADETIHRFVGDDGTPYDPSFRDFGGSK